MNQCSGAGALGNYVLPQLQYDVDESKHPFDMQVAELLVGVPAPIMYWEQGHEWLFGDPVRFQVCIHCSTMLSVAGIGDGHSDMLACSWALVHKCSLCCDALGGM